MRWPQGPWGRSGGSWGRTLGPHRFVLSSLHPSTRRSTRRTHCMAWASRPPRAPTGDGRDLQDGTLTYLFLGLFGSGSKGGFQQLPLRTHTREELSPPRHSQPGRPKTDKVGRPHQGPCSDPIFLNEKGEWGGCHRVHL